MKTISVLTILVIATFSSFAQTGLSGRFELGGSIGYSYSSMNTFSTLMTSQSISIYPKIGFFLTPALEVTLGPTMLISFMKVDPGIMIINGFPFATSPYRSESYNVGFSPGITYHLLLLDEVIVPFAAVSGNILWNRVIAGPSSRNSPGWSKPTIYAPTVDAGVRIFLSNDWALQVALTYSRNLQQQGDADRNGYTMALGTGFAIFL